MQQAVIDYLSTRSNLDVKSMQVEVTSVTFRKQEADATVSFRPKGTDASAGMQMQYTLEQKGNRWVVKGRAGSQQGGNPHGGMGQMPGMTPGTPGAAGPDTGMPPGHPPIGKPSQSSGK